MYRVVWLLGISVLALLAVGFVVLASAGSVVDGNGFSSNPFLFRQFLWLLASLPCFVAALLFDYHKWRDMPGLTILVYLIVVGLLCAVFAFEPVKGSRRWLDLGPLRLQPSELAKIVAVIAVSVYLDRKGWMLGKFWKGAFRAVLVAAVPVLLVVVEPDFGATTVLCAVVGALFLLAGMRFLHLFMFAAAGLLLVGTMLFHNSNRMSRISAWWNSHGGVSEEMQVRGNQELAVEIEALQDLEKADGLPDEVAVARRTSRAMALIGKMKDYAAATKQAERLARVVTSVTRRSGGAAGFAELEKRALALRESCERNERKHYQLDQSLVAIRNGGATGVGFNNSRQKQKYLPEHHTDFIFAIGAEEFGLPFSLGLLGLFGIFFWCGMYIAAKAPDRLGRMLAYGMSFLVFFQVLFNFGVVTGCLPTKGIALPFVSYGGTNLMTVMIAVGFLFNVARQISRQSGRPRPRSTLLSVPAS